jgi:hypothetical protein
LNRVLGDGRFTFPNADRIKTRLIELIQRADAALAASSQP